MHLIQQKVSKGIDPPQALTADMIPPSERGTPVPVGPTHTKSVCLVLGQDTEPQFAPNGQASALNGNLLP